MRTVVGADLHTARRSETVRSRVDLTSYWPRERRVRQTPRSLTLHL